MRLASRLIEAFNFNVKYKDLMSITVVDVYQSSIRRHSNVYAGSEEDPAYKGLTSAIPLCHPSPVPVRNRDSNMMLLDNNSTLLRASPGNVPAEE